MQYSEKFGFFLPSRDVGDYADINQISYNFRVIDENVPKKNEVEDAIQSNIDQTYNHTSKNAQSGKAVEQAIQEELDLHTDKTYLPTSENAQSGIAVAEALATVSNEKEWELLEDITLTEDVVDVYFDLAKINAKSEIHIEGYVVPKDNTVAGQTVAFNDGTVRWSASISCKSGKFYILMGVYKSPRNTPIFDGSVSTYAYSISNNNSFRMTSIDETLSVSDDRLIKGSNFRLRTGNENPMTVGTRIKVWGR